MPNPLDRRRAADVRRRAWRVVAVVVLLAVDRAHSTSTTSPTSSLGVTAVAAIAYFALILSSTQVTAVERSRVWSFVPLFITNAVFWSLYQQQFTVVSDLLRQAPGPRPVRLGDAGVVGAVDQPGLHHRAGAASSRRCGRGGRSRQPSTPVKFGLGTVVMGVAFLPVPARAVGANAVPAARRWPASCCVFTLAELLISPVGLSLSTKLAPARVPDPDGRAVLPVGRPRHRDGRQLAGYYDPNDETGYFLVIGLVAIAVGALVLVFTEPIRRLMAGVRCDPSAGHEGPGQRQHPEHQHHRYGEADPQRARAHQAGQHRAEQRPDVVELVEPGDHRVDPGLPDGGSSPRRRDPGRRGEAQRRDDRDAGAEQGEAQHGDRPGRARRPPRRGAPAPTTAPTRRTGTAPYRATRPSPASRKIPLATR